MFIIQVTMSNTVLYTDLSAYYDLMCGDINYQQQSAFVHRINTLLGNQGKNYLDMACGTGPHVKHFLGFGYKAQGLDINQPMLDIAQKRCPSAHFTQQDMASFRFDESFDLISCFLYSMHYNANIERLQQCIASVYAALNTGGVFCFNAVDKNAIDNSDGVRNAIEHEGSQFVFQSGWHYGGSGDKQELRLRIEKTCTGQTQSWQDTHQMVAISFEHLQMLLSPYFEVHVFEHDYEKIVPWNTTSGNAIFVCVKQ
jgi:ubiquinone/menaquinone biosynthesis C-methylase UbiE